MLGLIIGPILSAVAGEWLARRNRRQAAKAGIAAGIGSQMTERAGWFAGNSCSVGGEGYLAEDSLQALPGLDLRPLLLPMALCTGSRVRDGECLQRQRRAGQRL